MKRTTKDSIGALFPNTKKKNPKAPSLMGTLSLDRQLFEDLMNIYEETGDVAIQVSAWKNFSAETETPFLTLKAQHRKPRLRSCRYIWKLNRPAI